MAVEEQTWFKTPWPLNLLLAGIAVGAYLLFGNPFEVLEHQELDQFMRLRLASGYAPAVDPRIIHLDITQADLDSLPSIASEYQAAGRLIQEAADLGADLIILDVIYNRGNQDAAQPILDAIEKSRGVVLAEGVAAMPGSEIYDHRMRSFPFLPVPVSPSGLINIQADSDGVYRHYQTLQQTSRGWEPSLALAAYFKLKDIQWPKDVVFSGDHN